MSSIIFNNRTSLPDSAGSGKSQIYPKTDGELYHQHESGTETRVLKQKTTGSASVGVGTTSPQGALHVKSTGSTASLSGYDAPNHAIFGMTGSIPISASAIPKFWASANLNQADPGGDTFGMGYNCSSVVDNTEIQCTFNLIEGAPNYGDHDMVPVFAGHKFSVGYSYIAAAYFSSQTAIVVIGVNDGAYGAYTQYGPEWVYASAYWH